MVFSSEVFKYWIVDRKSGRFRIVYQDGRDVESSTDGFEGAPESQVARAIFDWERWWVANVTTRGHIMTAEAYSPATRDSRRGRPSVYLDQNHWRSVAQVRVDVSVIKSEDEADAARRIAELAEDLGVVIPLSSAHMRETAPLFGDLRYNVGVAMASLSAGWQMRHPTVVWLAEVTRLIADLYSVDTPDFAGREVVTLEPYALIQEDSTIAVPLPDGFELFVQVIGASSVMLEMLIDPKSEKSIVPESWVAQNQAITDWVSSIEATKDGRRHAALQAFWLTNFEVVRKAGRLLAIDVESLKEIEPKTLERLLRGQPMLSYVSQIFASRYMNRTTRWKSNDLTDILFLGCAAGYCDFVVAERHTGQQLRDLQRAQGREYSVFTNITDLRAHLDATGVSTEAERVLAAGGAVSGATD